MLSNTATPKYYAQFRKDVLSRKIPVNAEISMEMNRIDRLIENPIYYYDDEAIDGWIRFCEEELTLTDGSNLTLMESFKLWGEEIFGWYYYIERTVFEPDNFGGGRYITKLVKKRLTVKQYLIVARGAAKTMYLYAIHSYFLTVYAKTTHQISVAPTMKQSEEVLSPLRTAITRARGPYFKFLTEGSINNTTGSKENKVKLAPTKKGIENFINGSLLETIPMSIDKLQGYRPMISSVDEWLSGDTKEDVVGAIEQGASKLDDYLIIATSSEGTVRNSVGDTIKQELLSILRGEYNAPHISIFYYKLDAVEEVSDPSKWIKANPNLGKTVSYEAYALDVDRAEHNPSARNDILAKRFGIPLEGYTYFFTYEETLPHRPQDFTGMTCSMGVDLSQGDDFCAFTFLFPLGGDRYGVKCRSYISSRTLNKLQSGPRAKYDDFIKEKSLCILDGIVLKMDLVYEDLDNFITQNKYDVVCVGYDPYNAKEFIDRWQGDNGPYGLEKVRQGSITESVPLGELKKLSEDRLLIFDETIMTFTMGNCIVEIDNNNNKKLLKKKYSEKIDNVSALLDAWVAYKANIDSFK